MKILGFSGKKQSGKTTAALYCRAQYMFENNGKLAAEINFADALKRLVCEFFLNPIETGTGTYSFWSNLSLPEYKEKQHPCGLSYREIMQQIGTDLLRGLWPDIWVANYQDEIKFWERDEEDRPDLFVTADVRFPNEVKCIQDLGGHVIRLLRAPFPEDKHESETALDETEKYSLAVWRNTNSGGAACFYQTNLLFDAIIDNREMSIEQQNEAVWKLVNEKGWI